MTSNPDVPPFTGYVETTVNALRLIHAARQGVIPRITRRLNDSERRSMIKSGAVFVFSVEESGIKRWTDGLLWSPSRIVGNFLVYREINERASTRGNHKKPYPSEDSPTRSLVRKSSPDQNCIGLRGHGSDQGTFKAGGLIKKTITVTIDGSDLHLISYYTSEDIRSGKLKRPSARSDIMGLYMPPQLFRLTNFRVPPKVEMGPDHKMRLVEVDELDQVDCKVEDQGYHIPSSPTWSSHTGSPTSPIDNSFGGSSMYSMASGNGQNIYNRSHPNNRWPGQGDVVVGTNHRQDLGQWSPSASTLTSAHAISRRRDTIMSDNWSSIHAQSNGRWQSHNDDSTNPGAYPDRPRVRTQHSYDDSQTIHRRENDNTQHHQAYSVRYLGHPAATREGALQRLHWHTRDTPDANRDARRNSQTGSAYPSSSPPIPFSPQSYSTTTTYTSTWTPSDANMLTTPTLHPVTNPAPINYDGTYNSSTAISSPDDYTGVDDFQES
ncbi:Global transcription regulator FGP1 [Psilocybe cubensis]|uniref:Gti1/Pac2 family-domain-containing protein n=2 Tax=Psilocybe cubensis TaxID=181762 RepID=A0A8H7XKU5_PSICU|nr:Global transcription regulator FGP1 [Psilocybe cubensis]KAH9481870.1 Global transcription regulator FGP1 [Psilocybe cubensis]